jgi:putative PIN family toxin of toxin-antitoxin system
VLDTNVLVSATLNPSGAPAAVLAALLAGRFALVTSQPLLDEYGEVMSRPQVSHRRRLDTVWVGQIQAVLARSPDCVPVQGTLRLCRDPDDDIVLETAIRGGADTLVSRDEDLTRAPDLTSALAQNGITIMTVRQFLALLTAEQASTERGSL